MAEYKVGDVLYTVAFDYGEGQVIDFPYIKDMKDPINIFIVPLVVMEHYKVPLVYNDKDKKDCDGYVLFDPDINTWHNQYPEASYSQFMENDDFVFHKQSEEDNVKTYLLSEFMSACKKVFANDKIDVTVRAKLSSIYGTIVEMLKNRFNKRVEESEETDLTTKVSIKFVDGGAESIDEFDDYVIKIHTRRNSLSHTGS